MFTQFNNNHKGATPPISFESIDACYKTTLWKSKGENLTYKVIKYNNKYDVEVLCLELGNIMHVRLAALRLGEIKIHILEENMVDILEKDHIQNMVILKRILHGPIYI